MLAEQHVFSLMGGGGGGRGGRTFIIDVCPKVLQCVEQYSLDSSRLNCLRDDRRCPSDDWAEEGRRFAAGAPQWGHQTHPAHTQGTRCNASFTNRLCAPSLPTSLTSCLLWWRSSSPSSPVTWFTAGSMQWLTKSTWIMAICFTFARFSGWVATFRRQKNLPYVDQFFDPRWLARLSLLTDITTHLNALNMKLRGKDILVTDRYAHITAFDVKLRLWEAQLANGQL